MAEMHGVGPRAALVSLCAVMAALAASALPAAGQGQPPAGHAPHWTYDGPEGPPHWAGLSHDFASCGVGHEQSPIDIDTRAAAPLTAGRAGFDRATIEPATADALSTDIVNNGHTVQVDTSGSSAVVIGGERYVLQQFHFHSPSEHTVDGRSFPLEAHLVHKAADGRLAVVGVLFEEGAANEVLAPLWKTLPKTAGKPIDLGREAVHVGQLVPGREAYRYAGSLTTPPCSEGVRWFVMKEHAAASAAQIAALREAVRHNSRPAQPLNGRAVYVEAVR